MSEQWEFFVWPIDDHPAAVFVDLGIESQIPDAARPWLVRTRVRLAQPGADGLSQESESPPLYALEDRLFEALATPFRARYVGRITTAGRRDFFYYSPVAEPARAAAEAAARAVSGYTPDSTLEEDPGWTVYRDLLLPGPLDRQLLATRELVEQLSRAGDDLSLPRPITHVAAFPSPDSRDQFLAQVEPEGFVPRLHPLGTSGDADLPYQVELTRSDRADLVLLDPLVTDLFLRAADAGGLYRGWSSARHT